MALEAWGPLLFSSPSPGGRISVLATDRRPSAVQIRDEGRHAKTAKSIDRSHESGEGRTAFVMSRPNRVRIIDAIDSETLLLLVWAMHAHNRNPEMSVTASAPIDLSSVVESQEPVEAVLLITRTGAQLGAWTRNSVPVDVLSVMAATLVGSIETLMSALGASSPEEVSLVIDGRRVLVRKVNSQVVLVVVVTAKMTEVALRAATRQIITSLPAFTTDSRGASGERRDRKRF